MAYKYLYIDDEKRDKVDGTINGLNSSEYLKVSFENPDPSWDEQVKIILTTQKEIDGIILDLRLQEEVNQSKGGKASYRGSSLAQELRTLSKEGALKDIPIILLSATEQIDKSFDSTGVDLFDLRIVKDQVKETDFPFLQKKLISLAKAYQDSQNISFENIPESLELILGSIQNMAVDFRVLDALTHFIIEKKPFHQISRFLLKEVVCKPGVLINEAYVAARLGIDIENSEHWDELKSKLEYFKYNGLLDGAWNRWWAAELMKWWKEKVSIEDLQNLAAEQRVNIIKEKFGLKHLNHSIKLPRCSSTNFWVVCRGTGKPIAIVDGFRTYSGLHAYPWQEQEYVSIDAALERINIAKWKNLSPLENERLDKMQKFFTRERKR